MTPAAAFPTIPVIETARLRLRGPKREDFEAFAAFGVSPRSASVGGPFSRMQSFHRFSALWGHWAIRGFGRFVVADGTTDAALGVVGPYFPEAWPEPEIAWTVFDTAEGRGIAFEAATAARAYAFGTLGWRTAISCIDPSNHRSAALAERMGCTPDGVYRHPAGFDLTIWRHPVPEARP